MLGWRKINARERSLLRREGYSSRDIRLAQTKQFASRALVLTLCLVIGLLVGVGQVKSLLGEKITKIDALVPTDADAGFYSPDQQTSYLPVEGENILVVGVDSRSGANGSQGAGTSSQVAGSRSDSVMLLHVPASRKNLYAVSFPRDLNIDRPKCERWDSTTGDYSTDDPVEPMSDVKLNSVYATGGPKCLVSVIQQLSSMRITRFMGLDFVGFKKVVDAVGGVDICTNGPVIDGQLGTIIPTAGRHTLSGERALAYVRARKVEGSPRGDYDRIKRQQQFISSAFSKLSTAGTLDDPARLGKLADAIFGAIFVDNVTVDFLLSLGRSMSGTVLSDISFETFPTTGTLDNGNESQDQDAAQRLFEQINGSTGAASTSVPVTTSSKKPELVVPGEDDPATASATPTTTKQPVPVAKTAC